MDHKQEIEVTPGEDGFWIATIVGLPGAFSQGLTPDKARQNAMDAMAELAAARRGEHIASRDGEF